MTGWRLGFAIVNRTLAGLLDTFMANVHSCTATFTQYAGIEALTGPQHEVEKMRLKLLKRRDLGHRAKPYPRLQMPYAWASTLSLTLQKHAR